MPLAIGGRWNECISHQQGPGSHKRLFSLISMKNEAFVMPVGWSALDFDRTETRQNSCWRVGHLRYIRRDTVCGRSLYIVTRRDTLVGAVEHRPVSPFHRLLQPRRLACVTEQAGTNHIGLFKPEWSASNFANGPRDKSGASACTLAAAWRHRDTDPIGHRPGYSSVLVPFSKSSQGGIKKLRCEWGPKQVA